jgi:hypothetical protein
MRLAAIAIAAAAALVAATPAAAYRTDPDLVPQPRILYHVGLKDWKRPFARVVRALNRADVGVRLVRAKVPQQASIQIGRLEHRCGYPGVTGTTQTIEGGYAAIYLPYNCRRVNGSIIAAHELGHALGLLHDDGRCALMNSSGTGRNAVPAKCFGRKGINWVKRPFRADDLAGLRRAYRNTPPKVSLELAQAGRFETDDPVRFRLGARDRERNLSEVRIDFGDGDRAEGFEVGDLPETHSYSEPGTYTVTLTGVDLYGRRDRASIKVEIGAAG